MLQIINQTDEEKFVMYSKLTKKELISMLIEANKHLQTRQLTYILPEERLQTFGDVCSCNPKNGGSGVCGCIMGNTPIDTKQYTMSPNGLFNSQ